LNMWMVLKPKSEKSSDERKCSCKKKSKNKHEEGG
jgi:hypothetical protein